MLGGGERGAKEKKFESASFDFATSNFWFLLGCGNTLDTGWVNSYTVYRHLVLKTIRGTAYLPFKVTESHIRGYQSKE